MRRKGGLFWSICVAFHFLLFFIELPSSRSLRQQLPFSSAQSRQRLMGKWRTEDGEGGKRPNRLSVRPPVPWWRPWCITCFLPRDQRGQSSSRREEKLHRAIWIPWWAWGWQRMFMAQILACSGADKALAGGSWEVLHSTLLLQAGSGLTKGISLSGNGGVSSLRDPSTGTGWVQRKGRVMTWGTHPCPRTGAPEMTPWWRTPPPSPSSR